MNKFINFNNLKWTCHHLHIDKSNTINPYLLNESVKHMKNKQNTFLHDIIILKPDKDSDVC